MHILKIFIDIGFGKVDLTLTAADTHFLVIVSKKSLRYTVNFTYLLKKFYVYHKVYIY